MLRCVEGEDKVNAGMSKVMVMNGEQGLECEVHVDGIRLEHVSEFLAIQVQMEQNVVGRWRVGGGLQVSPSP